MERERDVIRRLAQLSERTKAEQLRGPSDSKFFSFLLMSILHSSSFCSARVLRQGLEYRSDRSMQIK
jgi:hypothetical protein